MKVGFFNMEGELSNLILADQLIRSVKKVMPEVPIVQFSNETAPQLYGTDDIKRLPEEPLTLMMAKHFSLCEGEWLFVDTDVIIQKDVRDIFKQDFDVAFTDRANTCDEGFVEAIDYTGELAGQSDDVQMFNNGVIFSRNNKFWVEASEKIAQLSAKQQNWVGMQFVTPQMVKENKYNVLILSGFLYNYPPISEQEDLTEKFIVHYKGKTRKKLMFKRFYEN